jgi:ferritin
VGYVQASSSKDFQGEAHMISKKMQSALNAHIAAENYSSYLYLAMAAWCDTIKYAGFGRWLRVQAVEEREHALKMLDYLLHRGGKPEFKAIDAPPAGFGSIVEAFDAVVAHERHVTALIHKLHATACAEKDLATQLFLHWFVTEQVQEEADASEIADKLHMVGDRPGAALYLDKEYGKRQG